MKYTRIEKVGNNSIEHTVEGDYEEVLAIFTEMNAKDAVEYQWRQQPINVMESGGYEDLE